MYKFEEIVLFNGVAGADAAGMRQTHSVAAHFSLRAGKSVDIAFIDMLAADTAPIVADRTERTLEFIKINSKHGFNQTAGYLIFNPELNAMHIISRDNSGHLSIDGKTVGGGFIAEHSGLFQNWGNALTEKACGGSQPAVGSGVLLINSLASFADTCNKYFSSSACCHDAGLIWNAAAAEGIVIAVNGMMSKSSSVKSDTVNAVRRFYVGADISVTRVNINLLDGHAGTGNDGWVYSTYFTAFNNATDGKFPLGGVVIYSKNTISRNHTSGQDLRDTNNKFRFYKDIIARRTNVSA